MNTLTDYQIINDKSGNPAFVVIPYEDFTRFRNQAADDDLTLPNEVVGKTIMEEKSLLCAWREYKQIEKAEMAHRMGMTADEYQSLENMSGLQGQHIKAAADILEIDSRLLTE